MQHQTEVKFMSKNLTTSGKKQRITLSINSDMVNDINIICSALSVSRSGFIETMINDTVPAFASIIEAYNMLEIDTESSPTVKHRKIEKLKEVTSFYLQKAQEDIDSMKVSIGESDNVVSMGAQK